MKKKSESKTKPLLRTIVISMVLFAAVAAMTAGIAAAQSATRTLPDEPVLPGANFEVQIEASGYGIFGQITETLPDGFTYVSSTLDPAGVEVVDSTVKFTFFGEHSFTYTVTASSVEGTYTFSGILKDADKSEYPVGGDTNVIVQGPAPTPTPTPTPGAYAIRDLPDEPVSPSANFDVGIEAHDYGTFGQVVETLPDGFTYVTSTLDPGSVEVVDSTVGFILFGETSFTYTVTASRVAGTYEFSGILKDEDKIEYPVGGDTEVIVGPSALTATRDIFSVQTVAPGEEFTVTLTMTASQVVLVPILDESLPEGWTVTTIDNGGAIYDEIEVTWLWMEQLHSGDSKTVVYNVTVPIDAQEGDYSITGTVSAYGVDPTPIGGESCVTVSKPVISIATDKAIYCPGDNMQVSIHIKNPMQETLTFEWYAGVPQFSLWIPFYRMQVPPGYDDTLEEEITIGEWGSSPFAALWYVHLLDQNGEALDQDCACWAYSAGRDKGEKAMPVDIAEEIGRKKTNISWE